MDKHAQILDCTLRDGAYIVDKYFGESVINGIVKGLSSAKIDYIEIGFLQNEGFGEGKTVFLNSQDAKKYVPKEKNGIQYTVLADYSRYNIENLDAYDGLSFDCIRACFFKKERNDVIKFCKTIKEKGYKLFVQPVDILGYSDAEIIDLIDKINEVEPYCFSIVDTFGSMYEDDLQRVYNIINHNLISTSKIGFHSHNNLQMSNALSQAFLKMTLGQRKVVVDATISGMGRGAGNTPTELVAQYMTAKLGYSYDMDALLDLIDEYMNNIRTRCSWGYTTPYFIAGCYSSHVNNISYLTEKNSIRSKDIRYILNKISAEERKRYNYDLLEATYMDYLDCDINDADAIQELKRVFQDRAVLIMAPGKSIELEAEKINAYIEKNDPLIIAINFISKNVKTDYLYFSNTRRYKYWMLNQSFSNYHKIITSNINTAESGVLRVSLKRLIKCGWDHLDNSTILLLRLLDLFTIKEIAIAGFDGYSVSESGQGNYLDQALEIIAEKPLEMNDEICAMLKDYLLTRNLKTPVKFVTSSRFETVLKEV